jgi:hypothetical protein
MPFSAPGSIKAKDADLADKSIATAQGDGLAATPYVPLHADIGVGDPSDAIATDPTDPNSLISLAKSILNQVIFTASQVNSIFGVVGSLVELPAANEFANSPITGLLKLLIKRSPKVPPYISHYSSTAAQGLVISNPCLLGAIDVINITSSLRYLRIYDANDIAAITPGATPLKIFPIFPNSGLLTIDHSHWAIQPTGQGRQLVYGLAYAISSTPISLNLGAASDCIVQLDFADLTL